MNRKRLYLLVCALALFGCLQVARAQQTNKVIWQVGIEDGGQSEFSQEKGFNDPPGDPTIQDEDFYFAGTYPDPIGAVAQTEPWTNFSRALTSGNPNSRIHFNLNAATAAATNELQLTVQFCCLGGSDGTPGTHDIVISFNDHQIYSTNALSEGIRVEQTFKAGDVGATTGENIVEIDRTDGSGSSWIQFDFIRLEIPASDTDGDGLPDSYEKQFPSILNPNDPSDAAKDSDNDGLTNLDEYKLGTDPTKADTDGDGLSDGDEVNTYKTNPLAKDSDKDGISDSDEVNVYKTNPNSSDTDGDGLSDSDEIFKYKTDPTLADTDGDGSSDSLELKLGSDPLDPNSKPITFTPIWLLGVKDNNQAEFSQEVNNSPPAPGSPDQLDDDFYFAGTYPDPIGVVAADEPFTNFERALTSDNPVTRIHFNLSSDQVKTNIQYLLSFNLIDLGSAGGASTHNLSFKFNGNEFRTDTNLDHAELVEETVNAPAVKAVVGENILEVDRTGGTGSSWIQFDYIEMDYRQNTVSPTTDSDHDGMTDANEILAGTNPNDPTSNLRVLSVKPSSSGVAVNWSSVAGKKYVVQYSPSLVKGSWVTVNTVDSAGATTSFTDTDSGRVKAPVGYYRIQLSP